METLTLPTGLPMDRIASLRREYHVQEMSLFGSVLRDDFGLKSDVDVLVVFQPDADISLIELSALQRKLATTLHLKVDFVPKRGLKPLIRDEVLASARVICLAAPCSTARHHDDRWSRPTTESS